MVKRERLKQLNEKYALEERQPDDIDAYEAADEWGITPKAAELRLNTEVKAGRMKSVLVRGAMNRRLRVWRDVPDVACDAAGVSHRQAAIKRKKKQPCKK